MNRQVATLIVGHEIVGQRRGRPGGSNRRRNVLSELRPYKKPVTVFNTASVNKGRDKQFYVERAAKSSAFLQWS